MHAAGFEAAFDVLQAYTYRAACKTNGDAVSDGVIRLGSEVKYVVASVSFNAVQQNRIRVTAEFCNNIIKVVSGIEQAYRW